MFESNEFVKWINELGCDLHHITPEMHHANGQVERYIRTILNMIRIQVNYGMHHGQTLYGKFNWS